MKRLSILVALAVLAGCSGPITEPAPPPVPFENSYEIGGMLDEFTMDVKLDPLPKPAQATGLFVNCSLDDSNKPFTGTVAYRVAASEDAEPAWVQMAPSGQQGEFRAQVTLPAGASYIHFRVLRDGWTEPTVTTDWLVEVE